MSLAEIAERFRALGFEIAHLPRYHREGFKAGALQEGMEVATGEFLVIFDADFVPRPDMLKRILPYFSDPADRHGPGPLGAPEPRLLPPDADPIHLPRRPLRHRAHGEAPLGTVLQLQRHGGSVAAHAAWRRRAAGSRTP